jgi:hypothetical protein
VVSMNSEVAWSAPDEGTAGFRTGAHPPLHPAGLFLGSAICGRLIADPSLRPRASRTTAWPISRPIR